MICEVRSTIGDLGISVSDMSTNASRLIDE